MKFDRVSPVLQHLRIKPVLKPFTWIYNKNQILIKPSYTILKSQDNVIQTFIINKNKFINDNEIKCNTTAASRVQ